jgi:hypothetical protein
MFSDLDIESEHFSISPTQFDIDLPWLTTANGKAEMISDIDLMLGDTIENHIIAPKSPMWNTNEMDKEFDRHINNCTPESTSDNGYSSESMPLGVDAHVHNKIAPAVQYVQPVQQRQVIVQRPNGFQSAQPVQQRRGEYNKVKRANDTRSVMSNAHGDPNSNSAVYARKYREEKKNQVNLLQTQVNELQNEKNHMQRLLERKEATIEEQTAEIAYLRSVIEHQSELAPIMSRVLNMNGAKLQVEDGGEEQEIPHRTRSATKRAHPDSENRTKRPTTTTNDVGLCVHVNGSRVSVEMCARCARQARSVKRDD